MFIHRKQRLLIDAVESCYDVPHLHKHISKSEFEVWYFTVIKDLGWNCLRLHPSKVQSVLVDQEVWHLSLELLPRNLQGKPGEEKSTLCLSSSATRNIEIYNFFQILRNFVFHITIIASLLPLLKIFPFLKHIQVPLNISKASLFYYNESTASLCVA